MTSKNRHKLTYKTDQWPDDGLPEELYMYVSRGKAHAGRLVIHDYRVDFSDLDMCPESKDELAEWIEILLAAWQLKEKQDKKGWSSRD